MSRIDCLVLALLTLGFMALQLDRGNMYGLQYQRHTRQALTS